MHRFILPNQLSKEEMIVADHDIVRQVKDVLRLCVGEKIIISDGVDKEAEAEILELTKKYLKLNVLAIRKNDKEPERFVTLYCAILKRENFEWVVQKAVETGVKKIVPVITDRTVKSALNLVRLQKIAKEAAEQSGRGTVPEIVAPVKWSKAISDLPVGQLNLFCHFGGKQIKEIRLRDKKVGVWVGPEGGWSEKEMAEAKKKDSEIVSLGNTVLRAETAATVGSFVAVNL